jgi:uncharacterized protein (DUF885 family)
MRTMTRREAAALAFAMLALAGCGPQPAKTQTVFAGFVDDATRDILQSAPELATQSGLTPAQVGAPFAGKLDDRSAQAVDLRRGGALRRYAQLRGIDRAALSAPERITYDVLDAKFAAAAAGARFDYGSFSALGEFSPYVLNQLDSAYIALPSFFERDVPLASFDDGELYLRRLGGVAAALDDQIARARADARAGVVPPDFVIDRALVLVNGFLAQAPDEMAYMKGLRAGLEKIAGPLPVPPAPDTPAQARARQMLARAQAIVIAQIIPAYRRTAAALAELRVRAGDEPGIWRLPDGDAFYRAALAAQTSTDLTPDQVHALGLARVKALRAELDMMLRSQGLTAGSVGQRLAQLTADPRYAYGITPEGQAAALADVRARIAAMDQRLPRWFRTLAKTGLEVRPAAATTAPSFSGGFYEAPPLNSRRAGAFILNLTSGGLNRIDLPTLVYHEAEPGHHLQISRALERTDAPILRRLIGFNAFSEGWGLYAEQLADEMGIYDGDPIGRIGYLRWQMWRAARLVVDTGMHAKHWTRAQAAAYLADTTGDSPEVIDTEIARYAAMPGQACGYELGRELIVRLRDKARAALGAAFDIRDFHEAILAQGDLPPAALEARVDAWIASVSASDGAGKAAR